MKRKLAIALLAATVLAAHSAAADLSVKIDTDNRIFMNAPEYQPDYGFYFNQNTVNIKAQKSADNVKGFADLDIINTNISRAANPADSVLDEKVQPVEFRANEAYVKFFGLFCPGLDVTVGRQIVAWGTADKFNQVSFVNPYNFFDMLDFGKRLGANAVRAGYTAGGFGVDVVYVPVFTPSLMTGLIDVDAMAKAKMSSGASTLTGMPVSSMTYDSVIGAPGATAENSGYAVRAGGNIFGLDMHASYYYGYYNSPVNVAGTSVLVAPVMTPVPHLELSVDGLLIEKYVKVNAAGYDIAGSFAGIGVWGEGAMIIPDKRLVQETTVTTPLISTASDNVLLDKKAYFKYTIGCDYTFGDSTYANLQLMHGFFTELGSDMSNLVMARIEKGFVDDKVKVKLEGGLELVFDGNKNVTPGALLMPGVTYSPSDATELELTGLKVFANDRNSADTHFVDMFNGFDQVILRASYTF
jgi:hypothetical protein